MSPAVTIIIPNWNGADLLTAYLPSVLTACDNYSGQSEVIVVDDASTDHSVTLLTTDFPTIKIVKHEHNQGFGRACWSGAQASAHPFLIFLNSDVKVEPNFIKPLTQPFNDHKVFAASPLILDEAGVPSDVTLSMPYFRRGKIRYKVSPIKHILKNNPDLPYPWYTLFPLGGAFAVRKDRFLSLHGFDDMFAPFYYEDTDLGFRAWRRGWRCVVVPESRVTHCHVGTIARSYKRFKIKTTSKRNRLLYLWKNLTTTKLLLRQMLFHLFRFSYAPLTLDGLGMMGTIKALPRLPQALGRRAVEKRAAVNSEEEIFEIIREANSANCQAIESQANNSAKDIP